MRNFFIFNGKNSLDFGIGVEEYPVYPTPERVLEYVSVPGRNGYLVQDTGVYQNVTQPYEIFYKPPVGIDSYYMAESVAKWLLSPTGYQKLEDSYNPDFYRMAVYSGPTDINMFFRKYGRMSLEFNCMPQRFLRIGDFPVVMENGGSLYNSGEVSFPIIHVSGSGEGGITIGNYTVTLSDIPEGLTIDCDTQNTYAGNDNKNNLVTVSPEFPKLDKGEIVISWSGGVTGVTITPRWWIL